jgi:Mg-chelatase subunit ChlD
MLLLINTIGWISAQENNDAVNLSDTVSQSGLQVDVVFVLDNSGSMIMNDPQFITREVVTNFLTNLQAQFRVGMVTFDSGASLIEPLSSMNTASDTERFLKSLERINYKGQFTNTPVGVERAIYELKSNGREEAEKIIILLTDGIVDTGDKAQDAAGEEWLKDQLALECKQAGIRVFGIAFTEAADFRLIQTLALKTDGEYFRTFSSTEIPIVFEKIKEIISKPKVVPDVSKPAPKPEPVPIIIKQQVPASPQASAEQQAKSPAPLLLTGLIIIVLVGVVLVYLNKKRDFSGVKTQASQADQLPIQSQDPPKGQAELIDADNVISETRLSLPIEKQVVKIGRDNSNDIVILKDSISSLHATIEYRNGYYYLEDQRSTNGTRLNDAKVKENTPMRLKSGDKVHFAVYEFRFLMPEMAPYGETVIVQSNTEPNLHKP